MRPTWIIADAHAGVDLSADRDLFRTIERATALGADLLCLGDLCVAWVGFDRALTPLQAELVDAFRTHRAAGLQSTFVVGNRDLWIAETQEGRTFDRVVERARLSLGGLEVWVEHGDQLRPDDVAYRSFRALVRSGPVRALARRIPPHLVQASLRAAEGRLSGTNRVYKSGTLPLGALEALGRRALAAGAERALVGHFHHDRTVDVAGGVPVQVAPPWLEARRVLLAEARQLRSLDPLA